jgi:hypothetical protein
MSQHKFTSGPWSVAVFSSKSLRVISKTEHICELSPIQGHGRDSSGERLNSQEQAANALLIAAAPALIAAAENVIDNWDWGGLADAVRKLAEVVQQAKGE